MPTPLEITQEKQLILAFCDEASAHPDGGTRSYGGFQAPFSFSIWFEGPDTVVINHVGTDFKWQRNGLFTFLLSYLESKHGIRRVGIKSAKTDSILGVITKRGYRWHPDDDYIKTVYRSDEVVALANLPAWLRKIVDWARKDRRSGAPY
jgi:hypothetical protein